jgi:predicted DNA-binding transcriptional regulator YafY
MKLPKLYQSEAWLRQKYRTMTAAQIADLCKVSEMTISRYLNKFGIMNIRSRIR